MLSFSSVVGIGARSLAREGVEESQFRRGDIHCGTLYLCVLCDSVADPCHFGVDPDPRIHASDYWIRIRIRIRIRILDPSPTILVIDFKMPAKNSFFNTIFAAYYFLKLHLHTSFLKDKK